MTRSIGRRWIYVSALRHRVHAGIRPSRAVDANPLGTNLCEGRFEMVLNAVAVGLTLPSGKRPAVIGNDEFEPRGHLIAWRRVGLGLGAARSL